MTLAFAESMTCGLAAHSLSSVKGVSEVLIASMVCYHEKAKTGLLRVPSALIKKYTAESQEVTDRMATELAKIVDADICAAITGLAAEGGSETRDKPVGTVFFSIVLNGKLHSYKHRFRGSPLSIRKKSCRFLFRTILKLTASH